MSKSKPSLSRGTRDFGPDIVAKRNYILEHIKSVYALHGFKPIETPAVEQLSTLMGKYGEEGDRLIFKILNSGDYLSKASPEAIEAKDSKKILSNISEKGLRYDLTVPFARYVVMNRNDIVFPFKRYQIQPVWRADKPQRGRYREFYQCDADVIGSNSLYNEAECCFMIDEVFSKLKVPVTIKLNNRKILEGLAEMCGVKDSFMEMVVTIDKIEKIGIEKVKIGLANIGLNEEAISKIEEVLTFDGSVSEKFDLLEERFSGSEIGKQGVAEMKTLFVYLENSEFENTVSFDLSLARGLGYYTGTIYECFADGVKMGSLLGGGRYDNLTEIFGMPDVSGVGISFGLDRIFDVLEEGQLFPDSVQSGPKVLFVNFDAASEKASLKYLAQLRGAGIASELYPSAAKMNKQMKYANQNKIPFVAMIGSNEIEKGTLTLKFMDEGKQEEMDINALIELLK